MEAVKAKDLIQNPGHWNLRPTLADFFNLVSGLACYRIEHIPRINNLIAHNLAKRAYFSKSPSSYSFLCSKGARCNNKMSLEAISFPRGNLIFVHCLGC